MQISIGSDHRGYEVKAKIIELLERHGHSTIDVVVDNDTDTETETQSVDYPDVAGVVARNVSDGTSDRGILICGTGIGMSIVANKYKGVRAAVCYDINTVEMSRRHNDLNVLCLSSQQSQIEQLVFIWLETDFEGGRHERRIDKIYKLEDNFNL